MKVLSIDWDYFVEEDPMLDFNPPMVEDGLFLTTLWDLRRRKIVEVKDGTIAMDILDFKTLLPFRGREAEILSLPCLRSSYTIVNTESHLSILKMIGEQKDLEIINIDAHHDLFYNSKPPKNSLKKPDCGSWGSHLILNGQVSSWVQVYPGWRRKFPEDYRDQFYWAQKKVDASVVFSIPQTWGSVDLVFICRSGCWTPPDYDHRFTLFCKRLGSRSFLQERKLTPESELRQQILGKG